LPFEINPGGSSSFFAILNVMVSIKSVAKIRAEHGTTGTEDAPTLLSITRENS